MPRTTTPQAAPADDSAGITAVEGPSPDPIEPDPPLGEFVIPDKVPARYVGIEPVMAHFNGEAVLVEPGDLIMVSVEQLEQNPVFESWED